MSMESIKQVIADNPGILQCNLRQHINYDGHQITKLVRDKLILRVPATRKNAGNTYRLYLPQATTV